MGISKKLLYHKMADESRSTRRTSEQDTTAVRRRRSSNTVALGMAEGLLMQRKVAEVHCLRAPRCVPLLTPTAKLCKQCSRHYDNIQLHKHNMINILNSLLTVLNRNIYQ